MAREKVRVDVRHWYGDLLVLDRLRFSIEENSFLCILGQSGCGKTTLANLMAGLVPCADGGITIDGEPADPRKHELAFVFQEPSLWPWRSVRDNIRVGLEIKGFPKAEIERRVSEVVTLVGLEGFEEYYPYQISGGMKQRVAIARAFALDADLVLMDEPFASLDAQTRQQMQMETLRIWEKRKTTVVFVTHNLEEAVYLAERILVLSPKPAAILMDIPVALPRPRDFGDAGFVALRKRLAELIGGW